MTLLTVWFIAELDRIEVSHVLLGNLCSSNRVADVVEATVKSQNHLAAVLSCQRHERRAKCERCRGILRVRHGVSHGIGGSRIVRGSVPEKTLV